MICRDCGKEFVDEEHPKRRLCDDCRDKNIRESTRQSWERRWSNPTFREKQRQRALEYYTSHKEECNTRKKQYYQKNREAQIEKSKQYYAQHREERKAYNREYFQRRKPEQRLKAKIYHREWYRRLTPDDKRRKLLNRKLKKLEYNNVAHNPFCQHCGRDFTPKYKGEKYCSEECYSHSPLRRIYERNPKAIKFLIDVFFRNGNWQE